MGTLNPYRAHFLDCNLINDTGNTKSVNYFSEMFEMFALLTSNFNNFWCNGFLSFNKLLLCYLFLLVFTCKALPHRELFQTIFSITYSRIWRGNLAREFGVVIFRKNLPQEFGVRICCRNFPWLFVTRICRGDLSWLFAVVFCICKQTLFRICEQILFIWKQTFFI